MIAGTKVLLNSIRTDENILELDSVRPAAEFLLK